MMVWLGGHSYDEAGNVHLPPEASIQQDPHQHKRYQLATQASQARRERDARRRSRLRHQQLASVPLAMLGLAMEAWLVTRVGHAGVHASTSTLWGYLAVLVAGVLLCCPAFAAFRK